ncbi:hypothetical protein QC762_102656 [Podospora pseudocomata]|uniref:Uncharacterized protein n=1 Tax=Podospora pseudocomata TaxID=2093779 RepID=A0ABR0GS96_9PEZI|nr:hypothetical protein QC762_102656 [Podospora pseudocomata]
MRWTLQMPSWLTMCSKCEINGARYLGAIPVHTGISLEPETLLGPLQEIFRIAIDAGPDQPGVTERCVTCIWHQSYQTFTRAKNTFIAFRWKDAA